MLSLSDSVFVDNLIALEQAIKDQNEKIKTFIPLVPIVGVGINMRSSFLNRINALENANANHSPIQSMIMSESDSDWSDGGDGSDTDVAGDRV